MSRIADLSSIPSGLRVATVCDALDSLGHRNQAMNHRVRPLDPHNCRVIGRARPWRWMECDFYDEKDPYVLQIAAVDALSPGDVAVHSTDRSGATAIWGELMSTVAMARGAVGCIADSLVRDCQKIVEMGFPVFLSGMRPLDNLGRACLVAFDVPIRCGGVLVEPGDLVFGDLDGVVVIPGSVESTAIEIASEKLSKEHLTLEEIQEGLPLREIYERHRVL